MASEDSSRAARATDPRLRAGRAASRGLRDDTPRPQLFAGARAGAIRARACVVMAARNDITAAGGDVDNSITFSDVEKRRARERDDERSRPKLRNNPATGRD